MIRPFIFLKQADAFWWIKVAEYVHFVHRRNDHEEEIPAE